MCVAGLAGGGPQQDYLVELGMPKAGVFLGYNVVDNAHFASRGGLEKWRGDVGGRFLVAASRFTVKKNLAALVRGFSEFARKKPESDLRLVIAGDGPLWNEVAGVVAECGMRGRVQLLGAVGYPEMPGLYAAASGFIHASTIEQWGLVVNEAMAAGLPVLVSERCGCAENLVAEGVNGKAFDPSSLSGIADVIEWFDSLSREYLGKMGEASRRVISSNGPKAFADGMEGASCYAIQKGSAKLGLMDSALLRVLLVSV
jgi:glycosyltransferase involved in cell wall biosynthesis